MPHKFKNKKPKAPTFSSAFGKTKEARFETPFGGGVSNIDKKTGLLDTKGFLSPGLQQALGLAEGGLVNNLSFLNRDPEARAQSIREGNDLLANVLTDQQERDQARTLGQIRKFNQATGNSNSTAAGSLFAQAADDAIRTRNQILLNSLLAGNQTALQNLAASSGVVTDLANLSFPLAGAANQNLLTALQSRDKVAAQNAALQAQAQQQSRPSTFGSILSGLGTVGGLLAAPFTGGSSLGGIPFVNTLGSIFGGGSSAPAAPSIVPTVSRAFFAAQNPLLNARVLPIA